ncbi:tudor and KH domain-containing protein homolog [Centruroides vittatus]|uniref:tudor and KH domain-containing protein homolog n=1 Tax=Centruroides vittatus TaxID=120091 RepID=UPI00350EEC7D
MMPHGIFGILGTSVYNLICIEYDEILFRGFNKFFLLADDNEERTVVIRGAPEDAQLAENIINKLVAEQPEIFTEQIYVPSRSCGRIIGKNGESIKWISKTSKAKVSIDSSSEFKKVDGQTRIVLRGTREQIDIAIGLIDEKLAEEEALRRQVELVSANRPTRYKGKLCLENTTEQGAESDRLQESLMPTGSDGFLEVFVSAVESPSQFWVQLVGTKSIQLDRMVEDMTSFYGQLENRELTKLSSVSAGHLVAAPFPHDNLWYRAKVTDVAEDDYSLGESKVIVFYVDFGDEGTLTLKQLFALRPEFLVVPFQAIECRLGNVVPRDKEWTKEAVACFERLAYNAQWKPIMAKPINYIVKDTDAKASIACVMLIDTNSETDINVAEELIRREYGVSFSEEKPK